MFKIESYLTPIILHYLAKYVKNIRPKDFQMSLWEGEVLFQNLDLRLDVLEQELNLPFEFLSGHIHELAIQVPWTKITSEPIKILINTIEFVIKAKSTDSDGKSPANSSPRHTQLSEDGSFNERRDEETPMGSGLAMKIINNINVQCQNIILKFVEEDIVVSMNVQYLSYSPANEQWQPAMVDVNPYKVLMRKLVNVSDLTICLDKRNCSGKIDVCQEPLLYRCTLEMRFLRKYNINTVAVSSTTRIGIFTPALDLNLSSLQVPMLMRLVQFLMSLPTDGEGEKRPFTSNSETVRTSDSTKTESDKSYFSWAWNMLAGLGSEELSERDNGADETVGHIKDIGLYIAELNFTLKNSEFINDALMGGIKRIRYTPIVRFSFGGVYFENVDVKETSWSSMKAGVSSMCIEPLGQYRNDSPQGAWALIDTIPNISMHSFIDKSLFDVKCLKDDSGWSVTSFDEYVARITDEYLLFRSPTLAIDVIKYQAPKCDAKDGSNVAVSSSEGQCIDMHKQCRVLSTGITLRFNQSFVQVKNIIRKLIDSYDSTAYSSTVESVEGRETSAPTKPKYAAADDRLVSSSEPNLSRDKLLSSLGSKAALPVDGSPKLHPPLVEDYDALMQGVPLCKYKMEFKRIRVEMYPITEPDSSIRIQRRLPSAVKNALPILQLYFDHVEGSLSTPLNPDKLVHTTCQLPDKPPELLDACYNNYELSIKDFSVGVMSLAEDKYMRLLMIPKLQMSYGSLLQPQHWKADEVPAKRLDMHCDQIRMEFSKRELFLAIDLVNTIFYFQPQRAARVVDILNHPMQMADSIALNSQFSKLVVRRRYYHTFDVWNGILGGLTLDVLVGRKSVQVQRNNVFTSLPKVHNNQQKWLEFQLQFPCLSRVSEETTTSKTKTKKESPSSIDMSLGLWVEKFSLVIDRNILDFLSFTCVINNRLLRDQSVESDVQAHQPQIPAANSQHTSSAPSISMAYQSNPALPQIFGRKTSRHSSSQRKISQPEETIHYSSEKDERAEYTATEALVLDLEAVETPTFEENEEKIQNYFKRFNSVVIYIELAQGLLEVTHRYVNNSENLPPTAHMRVGLPRMVLKSTFAEYITRSSLRLKVDPPVNAKTSFSWTIQLIDFYVGLIMNDELNPVLNPWQTTLTVAMTKRKQNIIGHADLSKYQTSSHKLQSPVAKRKVVQASDYEEENADNSSVSSGSLKHVYSGSVPSTHAASSPKPFTASKSNMQQQSNGGEKVQELICLNLHLDSSTVYILADNLAIIQNHLNHFHEIVQLSTDVVEPGARNNLKNVEPMKILAALEDNQQIKEFMELDSNSEISAAQGTEKKSLINRISLFCQWTIAKVIAEISSDPQLSYKSKIALELEDFLCTLDQGPDFSKYTNKIGNFNLNYYCQTEQPSTDWQMLESVRVRMIAETNDLPFLNVVITKVSARDFYARIGAQRKRATDRTISEIVIVMQALEVICDFCRLQEFAKPLCSILASSQSNAMETQVEQSPRLTLASELPLIHIESKGITCYFPLDSTDTSRSSKVLILKVDSINVTPNLQNPLQRLPLRPDVFGKAASMGILNIPGSAVEDRQYELTIKKISAASGNWHDILTLMRNKDHNLHTNPAVEWNNPERQKSLKLKEIFTNFTFIAIYAPNIAYNNILICGEAIELNCSSDFVASITTEQMQILSSHMKTVQHIAEIYTCTCRKVCSISSPAESSKSRSESTIYASTGSRYSLSSRNSKPLSQRISATSSELRRLSRLGSSTHFESIDEDSEHVARADSGVHSLSSKPSHQTRRSGRDSLALLNSSGSVLDRLSQQPFNTSTLAAPKRQAPRSISLVAGVFVFNFFDASEETVRHQEKSCGRPLLSFNISQPSFMITQNIYDHVTNFSIFNLTILMPATGRSTCAFSQLFIESMAGETDSTGIPPPLLTYKCSQTKLKMREIDIEVSKPMVLNLSDTAIRHLLQSATIIHNTIKGKRNYGCESAPLRPVCRKSKIMLMKANTMNADRLNVKLHNFAIKLSNEMHNICDLVCSDLKVNLKYLTRPEKCSAKYSLGSAYLRTTKTVFLHPVAFKGSVDFTSEPWNRLPLINVIVKFNLIQVDVGTYVLKQLKEAAYTLKSIAAYVQEELQRLQMLRAQESDHNASISRNSLRQMKCPASETFVKNNKSLKREEFYQDDLRAGAFQFVELISDAVLPLPYQIQIIKKDYGIICWRYPQPRKMCKIHIYPVPMAVSAPIHIKCRMEYFSEVHEGFMHFCDFWLSETISKDIKLPEREICATIWRVVILQSLVSVNGECFDTSEEDEELQSIATLNIDEVLGKGRDDSEYVLHPRVLVGCMRVDTTFQSMSVPKLQVLLSFNSICVKLFNKCMPTDALPPALRRFELSGTAKIPQAFLVVEAQNSKLHAIFYSKLAFNANIAMNWHIRYLDYGFLNMLPLVEETAMQIYFEKDDKRNVNTANLVFDRLRINMGPSAIHTLIASKTHWDEHLDATRRRNAVIPKCIVVNRTMSAIAFGQSGTNERIQLLAQECCLYSFRSDFYKQELTLYVADEETNTVDTSPSVHIPFKFDDQSLTHYVAIGNKCLGLKFKKLSGSQIYVLIKGQIELMSNVPHFLRLEFRREGIVYDESRKPLEYYIHSEGRCSFYQSVDRNTNINMRLRLADTKMRARTGDIPLKTNKKLPWLVKVPVNNNEFISFWVRILREDVPNIPMDLQMILITIWPVFTITSMLSYPIKAVVDNNPSDFTIAKQGGRLVLDLPATHLTEHPIQFKYPCPIGEASQSDYTLCLRSLDWQKFFWYDEQKWTIENAMNLLAKHERTPWPMQDEEELRIKRESQQKQCVDVNYTTKPASEFSCTLNLEVAPWGMFINSTGQQIRLCELSVGTDGREFFIAANGCEMLSNLSQGFTLGVHSNCNWWQSLPIYFESPLALRHKKHYVLNEADGTDIVIIRDNEVYKFLLKLQVENNRKTLKLCPKVGLVNYTEWPLYVLPFAMDHKENVSRQDVHNLARTAPKTIAQPNATWENSTGIALSQFYDINYNSVKHSEDSAFVYFVILQLSEEPDEFCTIPLPLTLPFNRRSLNIQTGKECKALSVSLIEHEGLYYLAIYKDVSPAVLVGNQTDCSFIVAQTNASENSRVSSTTPEYDGKHFEWNQVVPKQGKCYYTPPEWFSRFPDVDSTLCNITLALYDEQSTKKTIKWSKPIRLDKTWKKYLHIPGHGDVKVIICDKHRVTRIYIYYISQQMEFSVKDLRLRLSTTEPKVPTDIHSVDSTGSISTLATVTNLYTETPQFSKPDVCHHFRNECQSRPDTKLRIFIKEAIFSLHTDNSQAQYIKQEVTSILMDDLFLTYDDSEEERQLNVNIPNLQIDNQLFSTGKYDFPVVLCAEELYEKTVALPDPFYLGNFHKNSVDKSPMMSLRMKFYEDEYKLCSLNCSFRPVRAYIEDAYITDFLDALMECDPSQCVYRPAIVPERRILVENEICIPQQVESQALYMAEPLHLRSFCIEPMSVLLSVHTSVRLYIALDHSPLSFSAYERNHLLTMPLKFGQALGMHYLSGAIFGAGWVVGSLEILGSPSGLARSVTTGLKDFVSLPVRGLFRGPWGFVVGVTQGSASLLRNVTAGTVNSVTKLAASVARNLDRLSLDDEHIERTEALRRCRPQGFTEGFSQGMTGLGISMLGAVGGLAHHTLEARSPVEVFTGLSKGLVGALTKPISGAAELLALAGQGMLQTVGFNAMPKQRAPTVGRNIAIEPSSFRTWKLLPMELAEDQILFYHEVTLQFDEKLVRGYVFLTSNLFALIEAECDKLHCAFPVDKIQVTVDTTDKTLYYVNVVHESEDIEMNARYTNERIMNFLHMSTMKFTSDSIYDLLQTYTYPDGATNATQYRRQEQLEWSFYINENLGEQIVKYLKILNSNLYTH